MDESMLLQCFPSICTNVQIADTNEQHSELNCESQER